LPLPEIRHDVVFAGSDMSPDDGDGFSAVPLLHRLKQPQMFPMRL
jgi:hypothetical protein